MELNIESDIQFLARMLLNTREGHQIAGQDIRRLQDLAAKGPGPVPPTPPESHSPQYPKTLPATRASDGSPVRS
jgi:hypothetical protein